MDSFSDYIAAILDGVPLSRRKRQELEEELSDHLNMLKEELISDECSPEAAAEAAIEKFGESGYINKIYRQRYTRMYMLRDTLNRHKIVKETLNWAFTILVIFALSLSLRSYAFAATEIKQCSMQNTLFEGQRVIQWKIDYYFDDPHRGDIVIINTEKEKGDFLLLDNAKEFFEDLFEGREADLKRLVKRVIGLPGDTLDIIDGQVYINGELLEEAYVKGITFPRSMILPISIPEGFYFVMGDNRENSLDSRELGLISRDKIEGKAIFRFWPLDKFGPVD